MTKLGTKLIAAAEEAVQIASGKIPAARVTLSGHTYVPISQPYADQLGKTIDELEAELATAYQEIARLNTIIRDRNGEIAYLREDD